MFTGLTAISGCSSCPHSGKVMVVACMHKLVAIAYDVLRSAKHFDPNYLKRGQARAWAEPCDSMTGESFLLTIKLIEPLSEEFSLAQREAEHLFHQPNKSFGVQGYLQPGFAIYSTHLGQKFHI